MLGKWSAIAMFELQRIRFAGWALTEGQHRPKAGKKKRPAKRVFFFWFPLRTRCFIWKWVNTAFPEQEEYIYLSSIFSAQGYTWIGVDPVVSGTPGGAQGRSSWEGGRRRRSTGQRPVRKKRPTKWVFFFSGSHFVLDASSGSGLTQRSLTL